MNGNKSGNTRVRIGGGDMISDSNNRTRRCTVLVKNVFFLSEFGTLPNHVHNAMK